MPLPHWEIDLNIYGPITVRGVVHLREPKGFRLPEPFQSEIVIRPFNSGVQITATAHASTLQNARKVSLVFIGYMLDTLTLQVNLPIFMNYTSVYQGRGENYTERRIVTEAEWHDAFSESRLLAQSKPTFLRALGWYRKGLYTEDSLDSFLAFWNSIEIVAGKYHPDNEASKKGSKSQVWECFKKIWGECENWPVIAGQTEWIDENYDVRIAVAHGTQKITVEAVENVISKLPIIRDVAYSFLSKWKETQLNLQIPLEMH